MAGVSFLWFWELRREALVGLVPWLTDVSPRPRTIRPFHVRCPCCLFLSSEESLEQGLRPPAGLL